MRITDKDGNVITPDKIQYSGLDEEGYQTITVSGLPDDRQVNITYEADLIGGPGSVRQISNTASWKAAGSAAPIRTVEMSYTYLSGGTSSSESANTVRIFKTDQQDAQKYLAGAEFTLYDCSDFNNPVRIGDVRTNEKGTADLSSEWLHPNVLYKLAETKAPINYRLDDTPLYLYFEREGEAGYTRPSNLPEETLIYMQGDLTSITFTNCKEVNVDDLPGTGISSHWIMNGMALLFCLMGWVFIRRTSTN